MCFFGDNAELGCGGTNIQRLWFHPASQQLVGITRSGKTGPAFTLLNISTPAVNVQPLYHDLHQTYEFVSYDGYDRGVTLPNPAAFDGHDTLYAHFRSGVRHKLLAVSVSKAALVGDDELPARSSGSEEPFACWEVA